MKYQDILPDVLAGKLVRPCKLHKWVRMDEDGNFVERNGSFADCKNLNRDSYALDTWEVKPEEIYVWGYTKPSSDIFYKTFINTDNHFSQNDGLIIESEKPFLPLGKPQRYKLIPVDEETEEITRTSFRNFPKRTYPNININDVMEEYFEKGAKKILDDFDMFADKARIVVATFKKESGIPGVVIEALNESLKDFDKAIAKIS